MAYDVDTDFASLLPFELRPVPRVAMPEPEFQLGATGYKSVQGL
jgi:hypothetical protein